MHTHGGVNAIRLILGSVALCLCLWSQGRAECLSLRGEVLYFSPSYDETYFVINGSGFNGVGDPVPSGKRINNPVGYNFGFRLEGEYALSSCLDVGLRWTHVHAQAHEQVSNSDTPFQLWATENLPNQINVPAPFSGSATSKISVMYQKAEALFDERVWRFRWGCLSLREAIEWSYIRYQERVGYTASGGAEVVQFHGHTKGVGPELGVIAIGEPWGIFCWYPKHLALRFMSTVSLIAANTKSKIKSCDFLSAPSKVTQSSFWRFVPEWSLDFGIQYCLLHRVRFEIGYEITTYIRGVSKLIFYEGTNPGLSSNQYSNFCVHGLFFALEAFF